MSTTLVAAVDRQRAMTADPQKCCICGRNALWKVNDKGYCIDHRAAGIAEKIRWPREKKIDLPKK
jgi:hypothetical protein